MTTDATHWFSIEAAFVEIESLCVRARAAMLVQENERILPKASLPLKRTMASMADLRTMGSKRDASPPSEPPPSIPLADLPVGSTPAETRQLRAEALSRDLAFREDHAGGADIVELRDRIRHQLKRLENQLSLSLSTHDLYYALFPLVVLIDEMMRVGLGSDAMRWELLQSELFDIDNGGDEFFIVLEARLRQIQTPPLVLEVFYFCLAEGFGGAHLGDHRRLDQYRQQITARLPLHPVPLTAPVERPRPVTLVRFPWLFYAVGLAAVLATHALLTLLAPSP